jgi:hypothetical protein
VSRFGQFLPKTLRCRGNLSRPVGMTEALPPANGCAGSCHGYLSEPEALRGPFWAKIDKSRKRRERPKRLSNKCGVVCCLGRSQGTPWLYNAILVSNVSPYGMISPFYLRHTTCDLRLFQKRLPCTTCGSGFGS